MACKGITLVKTNISASFQDSAREWYTKHDNFNRDAFHNDPELRTWIKTLLRQFQICPGIILELFVDEHFTLANIRRWRPLPWYVNTIMRYCISANIVYKANQLYNVYRNLTL